jgi:hypothetical protein
MFYALLMTQFYEPDLSVDPDSPFVRDAANKPVRRSYRMDMNDCTSVIVMVNGMGVHLTNDEIRTHLTRTCAVNASSTEYTFQEILPPENSRAL